MSWEIAGLCGFLLWKTQNFNSHSRRAIIIAVVHSLIHVMPSFSLSHHSWGDKFRLPAASLGDYCTDMSKKSKDRFRVITYNVGSLNLSFDFFDISVQRDVPSAMPRHCRCRRVRRRRRRFHGDIRDYGTVKRSPDSFWHWNIWTRLTRFSFHALNV